MLSGVGMEPKSCVLWNGPLHMWAVTSHLGWFGHILPYIQDTLMLASRHNSNTTWTFHGDVFKRQIYTNMKGGLVGYHFVFTTFCYQEWLLDLLLPLLLLLLGGCQNDKVVFSCPESIQEVNSILRTIRKRSREDRTFHPEGNRVGTKIEKSLESLHRLESSFCLGFLFLQFFKLGLIKLWANQTLQRTPI